MRTNREEKWIIMNFTFYFIITFLLLLFGFSSIYPQLSQIEQNKEEVQDLYNNITRINKEWLNFNEFKSFSNNWENTRLITEILKNISQDFYEASLINTEYASYDEFLENKIAEISSAENIGIVENNSSKISNILPTYSDNLIEIWDNVLTDYKFVNYIESIIESFNFSTNSAIWITKVNLVEEFANLDATWDALDSNIYYIPLTLELTWNKESLIRFLYFVENVWNIEVNDKDIYVNEDYWLLSQNWVKKVLEWDSYSRDYNIFEHQIFDIEKIIFPEYIDSSYISRWSLSLNDFIINTQAKDKYQFNVNLRFYVKGQPLYKIEEYINLVLNKYKELTGLINVWLKNTNLKWIERINLSNNNDVVKSLNSEILTIKKNLSNKDKIEELYNKALKIDKIIDPIITTLK